MGLRTRRTRTRSVRLALTIMLAVPLTSLVALWAFAAVTTLSSALEQARTESVNSNVDPAATDLLNGLDLERAQSFVWLSADRRIPRTLMDNARATTDGAVYDFRNVMARDSGNLPGAARSDLTALLAKLGGLPAIRNQIDAGELTAFAGFQQYNSIVDRAFQWFVTASSSSGANVSQNLANLGVARASELGGREATLLDATLVTRGHLTSNELRAFSADAIIRRDLLTTQLGHLENAVRAGYDRVFSSPGYRNFVAAEDMILADANSKAPVPVNPVAWYTTSTSVLLQLRDAGSHAGAVLSNESTRTGNADLLRLGLAAGLGLLAVVASIFVLLRFGGRISRELTRLHSAAQELANERLPRVVERLRRGYDVDVTAEAPPIHSGKTREIAKVAQAFGNVQRTAVSAAVGQAELRRGIGEVYLNLARRNQSLLHRQLAMLDVMERRDNEPDALADLFRLDHLTTRMRRHAESLIILSGAVPARGWRSPVRMVDILRAAIAEVEDYTRVKVVTQARDAVIGAVVADIIHLLAELIENAAVFSPPNTPVTVTADRVANGFVVEIEDRGLGLDPDKIESINEHMANPPDFNMVAHSDQLGLFVVGRLAVRHGIKITVRPNPYAGMTAIVLMPNRIIAVDDIAADGVAGSLGNGGQALAAGGGDGASAYSGGDGALAASGGDGASAPAYSGSDGTLAYSDSAGADTDGAGLRPGEDGPFSAGPAQAPLDLTGRHRSRPSPDSPAPAGPGPWPQPTDETLAAPVEAETLRHDWHTPGPATAPPSPFQGGEYQDGTAVAGTHEGLPRRIRQASLAPQLRDVPPPRRADRAGQAEADPTRSAEAARDLMSRMQRGWERGRADAERHDPPMA